MTRTLSQAMQAAVAAKPGITMRHIAEAIGRTDRATTTVMSARLTQLCKIGKLRSEHIQEPGRARLRYFPTDTTGTDRRTLDHLPGPKAGSSAERKKAQRAAKRAEAPTAAPAYASAKATKPSPASHIRVAALSRPPAPPPGRAQTVEQFLAQGGKIQRLGPYDTSNPLRYDHSHHDTHTGRRRGAACHRKAGAL